MRKSNLFLLIATISLFLIICFIKTDNQKNHKQRKNLKPFEEYFQLKYYPDDYPDYRFLKKQYKEIAKQIKLKSKKGIPSWSLAGPGNIGGRINSIVIHPTNDSIIYAGNAAGGIFKTTDAGNSWIPIFDDFSYLSIGDITFEPGNPDVLYAGTGDPKASGSSFLGDGIYKTTDAGNTWVHLGLDSVGAVSEIIVDPQNTNIIYVATLGNMFTTTTERGLYKSTDGGNTWNNILFISDDSGICELIMDHTDPQILYATGWNRVRNNNGSTVYGQAAKIYKTTDGGQNWTVLSNNLPTQLMCKIGLCMSPSNADLLYAMYIDTTYNVYGIYKTTDAGMNWSYVGGNDLGSVMNGYGWYFGEIRINPWNDNELCILNVDFHKTINGGSTFSMYGPDWTTYQFHADKHDLIYLDSLTMICATDGGLYKTTDGGQNWTDIDNIPNDQFYRIAVDPHNSDCYAGGEQDNGTVYGSSDDIDNWYMIYGGDGFQPVFDPVDPNLIYAEFQYGGLVYTDGVSWYSFDNYVNYGERRCWDQPLIMSAHDNMVMYTGTYKIYKNTTSPAANWFSISPDLTDGTDNNYHVITAIEESPLDPSILYSGSSDAYVYRTLDGGINWTDISSGLPNRYVTAIKASPLSDSVVYVAHSGYKDCDNQPHLYKSDDCGNHWTNISGNLPHLPVNDIEIHKAYNDQVLFIANNGGVYYTDDAGNNWERAGDNMPVIHVSDIEIDYDNNKLIAGTFARSMMSIDIDSLITISKVSEVSLSQMNISVYPSVFNENITVIINDKANSDYHIELYDMNGKKYYSWKQNTRQKQFYTSDLKPGVYFLVIYNNHQKVTRKLIKR